MKISKYLSAVALTAFFSLPALSQTATTESIRQLMDKTGAGDLSIQVMNQMLPALKNMLPQAPEEFWTEIMAEVDAQEIVNLVIPIYQKHLTEEDISAINDFYDTPAGKKMINTQPAIMQESMAVGQQWGQNLAQEVMRKYQAQAEAK